MSDIDSHIDVEAGGDEGWHVESLSEYGAPAADVPSSTMLPAVAGLRCKTSKTGDLFVVELAEFGHFDEHSDGGESPHSRDREAGTHSLENAAATSHDVAQAMWLDPSHYAGASMPAYVDMRHGF